MTDFRRKPLFPIHHLLMDFHVPLWGTAVGNAMPNQGFDLATHTNTASSHRQSAPEMPSKAFKLPLLTLSHTRKTTVGSLLWGAEHGAPSFIPPSARYWNHQGAGRNGTHSSSQLPRGPAPQMKLHNCIFLTSLLAAAVWVSGALLPLLCLHFLVRKEWRQNRETERWRVMLLY